MEGLQASSLDFTVLFYNSNIHPRGEYELRKRENKRLANQLGIPFVDVDYDPENWLVRVTLSGNELQDNGLLLDFKMFKSSVQPVIDYFDLR